MSAKHRRRVVMTKASLQWFLSVRACAQFLEEVTIHYLVLIRYDIDKNFTLLAWMMMDVVVSCTK